MKTGKVLPIVDWLGAYQRRYLRDDISAGIIVAVMLVPQSMAYAMLAGLPPVVGLYASTIPLIVYALFGTSRQLAVGPVAMISLLVASRCGALESPGTDAYVGIVLLAALLVGVLQFVIGMLHLGFLTHFISHGVMSGFTSAAAVIIMLSQLKHLLGINLAQGHSVFALVGEAFSRIGETRPATLLIGGLSIPVLLALKKKMPRFPAALLVVIAGTILVRLLNLDQSGVAVVGEVPRGFPAPAMPVISYAAAVELMPMALTIVLVGFLESVAVAQEIAAKENYTLNVNQELRALGLANIGAAFFGGYPVTGGLSRTAVNYDAGAKTPLASFFSAVIVLLTLLFLTPLFFYLPKTILAAVVMVAVASLINIRQAVRLWRLRKADGLALLATFAATLLTSVELGVLAGVGLSLAQFIWRSSHPHMAELGYLSEDGVFRNLHRYPNAHVFPGVIILRIDASLYFANLEFVEQHIRDRLAQRLETKWIVLDMSGVNDMDAVAIESLERLMEDYSHRDVAFVYAGMKGPVRDIADKAGWPTKLGAHVMCSSIEEALRHTKVNLD